MSSHLLALVEHSMHVHKPEIRDFSFVKMFSLLKLGGRDDNIKGSYVT